MKRAVNVQVAVDGKSLKIKSAENTVEALLKVEGITLKGEDKVQPVKETAITKDLDITIIRVEMKTFTETADIPFNTIIKNNNNLANSVRKTIQDGKAGQKTTTTNVVYENGTEVSRTIVNETTVRKPVDTIISQGTLPVVPISRGGDALPYTKILKARATAYEPTNGLSTYTSSGRKAVRDPNGYSTIAVDPSVIPIGSKVFVEGYGLAYAADTGSAIKGTTIDVFFNTLKDANNWAVRYVNVYVLK
jgi:3D (Asp-Asp-Asp) domain-containing protein